MATILNGAEIAAKRKEILKEELKQLSEKNLTPKVCVLLIGSNKESEIYVRNKKRNAEEIGIEVEIMHFSDNVTQEELVNIIKTLNTDKSVHGILLQLPIPDTLDKFALLNLIDPKKDIDGLTPYNAGMLLQGHHPYFFPATAKGIYTLLSEYQISISGKHVVIVGRSIIVGRPLASLLLNYDATVTLVHSKTEDIRQYTTQADILVVAIGKPEYITADYIKKDAIVVDVGINYKDGKTYGDVKFDEVSQIASYISPVPKGVGPLTIVSLLENAYEAALLSLK